MFNNDFQRGAQTFSRGMTILGSVVLTVCVVLLTAQWWSTGRWLWVAIGIAIIAVNIMLVVLQFRRPRLKPNGEPERR